MHEFDVAVLLADHDRGRKLYHEFLRVPDLSVGLYALPAGGVGPQQLHTEDEVYYVVRGRGCIRVAGDDGAIVAGSIVYVPARVEHRFHSIEEELAIPVFFAPADYARCDDPA